MSLRTLFVRPLCLRVSPSSSAQASLLLRNYSSSQSSSSDGGERPPAAGSKQDAPLHVSQEAEALAKSVGETPPDISQGTPISEVVKRDTEAIDKAPKVLKKAAAPSPKREYSTLSTHPSNDNVVDAVDIAASITPVQAGAQDTQADAVDIFQTIPDGAKFPLPTLPLPPQTKLHGRYSPILDQVTNLIMRDGKKARAQSIMTEVLAILRTKSAPVSNPRTPIITTAPPLESLPSDPIAYLQTAVDSVAPLLKLRSIKGSGGFRESVPTPLNMQQRRRKAIMWIIEAADKKRARLNLAERLAEEIVAVVEGRSSAWEKRQQVHKTAVAARANVRVKVM